MAALSRLMAPSGGSIIKVKVHLSHGSPLFWSCYASLGWVQADMSKISQQQNTLQVLKPALLKLTIGLFMKPQCQHDISAA